MWDGWLAVRKPIGMTSHDVVDHVRKWLVRHQPECTTNSNQAASAKGKKKRVPLWKLQKVGHGGTLDPMASGVLGK
jgi:tRNA U55 pseudouridine synthase TruB